jgi:pimeloyl-ACP methyl ester carboxylesterase
MADYATDLAGVLDDLGFDRVVLAGHSLGGYVAFECLRRWPGRVRALALLATRAAADSPAAREKRLEALQLVEQGGVESISTAMVPKLLSPGASKRDPGLVEQVRDITLHASAAGIAAALEAMRHRPDSTPLLRTLTEPVLVLAGEADQIIPLEESRAMAEAVRKGTFEAIPGTGHLLTLEAPDHTVRAMQNWLDRLH